MEKRLRLDKSGSGAFNASGIATVVLRNNGLSRWVIRNTAVTTTSDRQTACKTYRGADVDSNLIDATRVGNARSSDTVVEVNPGEYVTAVWTGGTPGTIATVIVSGDDYHRGLRAY